MAPIYKVGFVLFVILFATCLNGRPGFAERNRLPVIIQAGYEENGFGVFEGGNRVGATSSDSFDTDRVPLFRVLGPTWIWGCPGGLVGSQPKQFDMCAFGLGGRFLAAQKRLDGAWIDLAGSPEGSTTYSFNSSQFAGEIVLGLISEISFGTFASIRGGFNSYDLLVQNDSTILFYQRNKLGPFLSFSLNLSFGIPPVAIIFSYEKYMINRFEVPNINSTGEQKIDLLGDTRTIMIGFIFGMDKWGF